MNGREAARLAKEIGARLVIPCHYDMFEFNTADPRDEFIPECERLGQPYRVPSAGRAVQQFGDPAAVGPAVPAGPRARGHSGRRDECRSPDAGPDH